MILDQKGMKNLAQQIAAHLKGGEILVLVGDLAAGKTFFTQALGQALGAKKIKSPTFIVLDIHQTKKNFKIAHFDFYRLEDKEIDWFEWRDYLGKPEYVSVIEWGEKIKPKLSQNSFYELGLKFTKDYNKRKVILSPNLKLWLEKN
jgi:tRNA threonylcarbamoyladenosine biosynthesis protein TsaE